LQDFGDNYFGDHVSELVPYSTVVYEIEPLESPTENVKEIEVTFMLTSPSYVGTSQIPSMECLEAGWSGYNEWNFTVNQTYERSNYFVDKEKDKFVFQGTYRLSKEANRDLYTFWKDQRGEEFTITDGDWGVGNMFGPNATSSTHDVVIESMDYNPIGPTLREVTVTLIRNDGAENLPPVFILQPVDWTGASGGTAVFTTDYTGTEPVTLQWRTKPTFYEGGTVEYPFVLSDWTKKGSSPVDAYILNDNLVIEGSGSDITQYQFKDTSMARKIEMEGNIPRTGRGAIFFTVTAKSDLSNRNAIRLYYSATTPNFYFTYTTTGARAFCVSSTQ
jgi:hypothetical protein